MEEGIQETKAGKYGLWLASLHERGALAFIRSGVLFFHFLYWHLLWRKSDSKISIHCGNQETCFGSGM